jgi:aryl-alcohol dehydrogenase-like predicted oxidoreductase
MSTTPFPRRRLGRTNTMVTAIGLGGAGLNDLYGKPSNDAQAIACVRRALELGINYIDTSPLYGESERRLGVALREIGAARPADLFLATKTGTGTRPHDYSREGTLRSVENSLRLLGVDHVGLMQIHDPVGDEIEAVFAPGGALETLVELKEQKVIGAIGIGVRTHSFLLRAIHDGRFDTILTFADFNPARQTARDTLFPEAKANDVGVILGSPLLFGYLSDRPWDELLKEHGDDGWGAEAQAAKRVRDFADRHGISSLVLALQYALREERISTILVGAASAAEIEQNVQAVQTPLPETIWTALADELGVR